MGPEDKVDNTHDLPELSVSTSSMDGAIPGLDFDMDDRNCKQPLIKKVFFFFLYFFKNLHVSCVILEGYCNANFLYFNLVWHAVLLSLSVFFSLLAE